MTAHAHDGTDGAEDADRLDPTTAADLIARTERSSHEQLRFDLGGVYGAWGAAWFIGYGCQWLSVHGQHPYAGPHIWAYVVLALVLVGAFAVTLSATVRATRGVHGPSRKQGRLYGLSWPVAMALTSAMAGVVGSHTTDAALAGTIGAASAPVAASIVYLAGSAIWSDVAMFALGVWLAIITVAGAYAGPSTLLAVEAVAGGIGFGVAAVTCRWRVAR